MDSLPTKIREIARKIQNNPENAPRAFVGFDGFTDEILHAVDTRHSPEEYSPIPTIEQLGERIKEAAGKSTNIELVLQQKKLGGNAPILTNALLEGGHQITFVGAIGTEEEIEPIFEEMASRCARVVPLCPSAHSDAIEFQDGKVILGKLDTLKEIYYKNLIKHLPVPELTAILDAADLLVTANWTMVLTMTELWRDLQREILPQLSKERERWLFVDLADPRKRTKEDLADAMQTLKNFSPVYRVILGLNQSEAERVGSVLNVNENADGYKATQKLCHAIQQTSGLERIVVHATKYAVSSGDGGDLGTDGPYTSTPKITTGAGDNFNAGYCNGLLHGLSAEECLQLGVATSGYYVRNAASPSLEQLADFLESNHAQK